VDFSITSEQKAFRRSVSDFAKRELGGDVRAREKSGEFFWEGWKKCAEFGIHGMPMPSEFGGLDLDTTTCLLAMQALGRECRDSGFLFSINSHMWTCEIPILEFGSEEQKANFLPKMIEGELVGGHAMTEPGAGSDAYSLSTTATKTDAGYVLNGSKVFISNAPIADLLLIFATTNRDLGWAGVTGFLVEKDNPGLHVGKALEKIGLKTSPTGELSLQDCEVPASAMLGRVGQGSAIFNAEMEWERSCLFACHLGAMERQLRDCVQYVKDREQFGQPIGKFQAVSHKIADMRVRIELGELILHKVAWMKSRGKRAPLEAAIAKLVVSESYMESSIDALHLRGGYGFMSEYEADRDLLDAAGGKIYSGTSEVQRNIIARFLGL
jgi:alkylation response protein AidB-like acyl-CoA dehydrogenase